MKLLEQIQIRMAAIPPEAVVIGTPVNDEEMVVGYIPEDLVRMYCVYCELHKEYCSLDKAHDQTHEDSSEEPAESSCKEFVRQMKLIDLQMNGLWSFFNAAVRFELNIPEGRLALRAGGAVVVIEEPEDAGGPHGFPVFGRGGVGIVAFGGGAADFLRIFAADMADQQG